MRRFSLILTVLVLALPAMAQNTGIDASGASGTIGKIPCTPNRDTSLQDCDFGVTRDGDGAVTIRIQIPGGDLRSLNFESGELVSSNAMGAVEVGQAGKWTIVTIAPAEHIEFPTDILTRQ